MNRTRLLIILFAVLALSLAYAYWRTPQQERVSRPSAGVPEKKRLQGTRKGSPETRSPAAGDDLRVRLDLLQRAERGAVRPRRDLFASFAARPGKLPVVVLEEPPPPPVVIVPPAEPELVVEPPPPGPPPEPPVQIAFLGFLHKEVERTVFLSAAGEIYVVKKGDRFGRDHQFTVTDLTAERVVIKNKENQPIILSIAEAGSSGIAGGGRSDSPARLTAASRPFAQRSPPPPSDSVEETEAAIEAPIEEAPAVEQGMLRPLQRSNLNNIFSDEKEQTRSRPPVQQPVVRTGAVLPSEEVP